MGEGRSASQRAIDPVAVHRVGRRSGWLTALIAITVLAVAVAILKPWSAGEAPRNERRLAGAASTDNQPPSPSPSPSPIFPRPTLCAIQPEWRLVTHEDSPLGDSRTLYGLVPAPAVGPSDQSMPTARLNASTLYGIGVARPLSGSCSEAGRPFDVHIWLVPVVGRPVRVDDAIGMDDTSPNRLGQTYFVLPDRHDYDIEYARPTRWGAGRYVVEIDRSADDGGPIWVALEFAMRRSA